MESKVLLGNAIKKKRLALNMTMDMLAKRSGISRPTLSLMEKGEGSYSISALLSVLDVLGLSFSLEGAKENIDRVRATRTNTLLDKKINRFIIMCTEQYASYTGRNSGETYKELLNKGIIDELRNDYEDLHGMSSMYLNDYIYSLASGKETITESKNSEINSHQSDILAKTILVTNVTELIAKRYKVPITEARYMLYESKMIDLIDDKETGLYGESPLYILSLFETEEKKTRPIPNKATIAAIEEAEEIEQGKKNVKTFTNVEDLMDGLEK